MLDPKKNLRTYMTNFTGSYIGFFSMLSEIIGELGTDWAEFAETNGDQAARQWSNLFIDTSKTLKQISDSFTKVSDEFNKREVEVVEENPQALIDSFKDKVNKVIGTRDGKPSNL